MLATTNFYWTTKDHLKIYGVHWPVEKPKAVIALVHGLGEHIHRFDRFAAFFQTQQIALVGYDRRGHGRSEGKRGHTVDYEAFLDEVGTLLTKTAEFYPNLPVLLFGHSMGGNLVLKYMLERQSVGVTGCIVSSPWIQLVEKPSPFLIALGRLMVKVFPGFTQPSGLDPAKITTVPAEVEAYKNDPLVHDKITSVTGISMLNAAEQLAAYQGPFPVPLLIYHGEQDPIVDVSGSRSLVGQLSGDVRYQEWPGLYHETHYEANWQEVLGVVLEWIEDLLAKK